MGLLFLPPCLFLPTMCCSGILWNSVFTVEPHSTSLRNAHACSFNIRQFSTAWAEIILVQSLQESAQWVFDVKNKMLVGKKSADPTAVLNLHKKNPIQTLWWSAPLSIIIWPSHALIISVCNMLEIVIYFDAILPLLSKYMKPLT